MKEEWSFSKSFLITIVVCMILLVPIFYFINKITPYPIKPGEVIMCYNDVGDLKWTAKLSEESYNSNFFFKIEGEDRYIQFIDTNGDIRICKNYVVNRIG